jgi:hypothetical protein
MTIDKRVIKNQETIVSLQKLLIDICKNPEDFDFEIYSLKLKSQNGLSKIIDQDRKIFPSSINTLKRISPNVLKGGFDELNKLRVMAYDSLCSFNTKEEKSNKINKAGLHKRVSELEEQVSNLQQAHLLSINTIMEDLNTFNTIVNSKSKESIKSLSAEAIERLQTLSLISPLFLELKNNNVINIKDK